MKRLLLFVLFLLAANTWATIPVAQLATRVSNRFNVTISSSSPQLIANYTYILPTPTVSFLFGSFYAAKVSGANSNLFLSIVSNGATLFNESVVSFLTNGDYRTISFPKAPTNVSNASTNTLQLYAWSSAGSSIALYDVGFGLTFDVVSDNVTNITYGYGAINTSWSGTANTQIGNLSVNNSVRNSDVYASYYGIINASGATIVSAYLKDNITGYTSPPMSRILTSSGDKGVLSGSWIFRNVSSTQILLIVNNSNSVTTSWDGNKFNKNYNNSNTNIANYNYSVTSPISIGATYTVIFNQTFAVQSNATTGIFVENSNTFQRITGNPVIDEICQVYNNSVLFDTKYTMRSMDASSTVCEPKIIFFSRYASEASLYPNNITVVCSAKFSGVGSTNLISASLVLHELLELNATYIPHPPIVDIWAPDNGSNQMGNYSINWTIGSLYPVTVNLTLTNTSGYKVNVTGMNASNTTYTIDTTGYNTGWWIINVSSNNAYGTGSDQITVNYTATTPTTTTTTSTSSTSTSVNSTSTTVPSTTTSSSSTTSTTLIPAGTHGVNEIYAVMFPVFAFLSMLSIFIYTEEDIVRIVKPLISATLWFISGYFTVSIRYVGDFTTIMSPYYVDDGNGIVGAIFLALSGLFFAYSVIMIVSVLLESAEDGNGQRI